MNTFPDISPSGATVLAPDFLSRIAASASVDVSVPSVPGSARRHLVLVDTEAPAAQVTTVSVADGIATTGALSLDAPHYVHADCRGLTTFTTDGSPLLTYREVAA